MVEHVFPKAAVTALRFAKLEQLLLSQIEDEVCSFQEKYVEKIVDVCWVTKRQNQEKNRIVMLNVEQLIFCILDFFLIWLIIYNILAMRIKRTQSLKITISHCRIPQSKEYLSAESGRALGLHNGFKSIQLVQ